MTRIARPAKIVERMVNQNTYDEYAQGTRADLGDIDIIIKQHKKQHRTLRRTLRRTSIVWD